MSPGDTLPERQPLILDTDIGTDVDDVLALALALRCPAVELLAVTTVYGDAGLRARMVRQVLAVAGRLMGNSGVTGARDSRDWVD